MKRRNLGALIGSDAAVTGHSRFHETLERIGVVQYREARSMKREPRQASWRSGPQFRYTKVLWQTRSATCPEVVAVLWFSDLLVPLIAWGTCWTYLLYFGWPQPSEGATAVRRLSWVAAVLALIAASPAVAWTAFRIAAPLGIDPSLWLCIAASAVGIASTRSSVRASTHVQPPVDDEEVMSRIDAIAHSMEIAPPSTQVQRSHYGHLEMLASGGWLNAPTVVVSDGILYRAEPADRDATLAHELAHIANGTGWYYSAVAPLAGAIAVSLSAWIPATAAACFGIALATGARRFVSRQLELDCDRRGAKAVGFRSTAANLAKLDAVYRLQNPNWLQLIVHATATHPSVVLRERALAAIAPQDDRPVLSFSHSTYCCHRWAAIAAFATWVICLVTGFLFIGIPGVAHAIWLIVPVGLIAISCASAQQHWARYRRLYQSRNTMQALIKGTLIVSAAICWIVFGLWSWPNHGAMNMIVFIAGCAAVVVAVALRDRRKKIEQQFSTAMSGHDFQRVVELAASYPKQVRRSDLLRYTVACSADMIGDRQRAIRELEQLRQDRPHFKGGSLMLAHFYLDDGLPERAQELAREVADIGAFTVIARACLRLGDLDEAERWIEQARLGPRSPRRGTGTVDPGDLLASSTSLRSASDCP